jgi:phage gpG-like protein
MLTGVVKNIQSEVYGNFDLEDATGSVYVYGLTATPVSTNDQSFSSIGIKEGDTITIMGTRTSYNGTPQVGGPAYYVSHIQ